jgi:hypothetical protein
MIQHHSPLWRRRVRLRRRRLRGDSQGAKDGRHSQRTKKPEQDTVRFGHFEIPSFRRDHSSSSAYTTDEQADWLTNPANAGERK